jgi:SAM-dependent methyltransferase
MSSIQADILERNRDNYEDLYSNEEAFLRYPADWVIRFHNMYLKQRLRPDAAILDYGCGGGNNSCFFLQKDYTVSGVDVAPEFKTLVGKNLELHNLDPSLQDNFKVIDPDSTTLDFPDNHFDFVLSNQVLYYLPSVEHIKKVCNEIRRVLRPNGCVFFTMIGLRNYYITHYLRQVHDNRVFEIGIEDPEHRLKGIREYLLPMRDEEDLRSLFDMFEPLTIGYFDQSLFDVHSNFHYIFSGIKTE